MKILQYRRGQIYDIGFIDPYVVYEKVLVHHYQDTENNLVNALLFNENKREILFPYNFG